MEQIAQTVRLIRSKGVGVFFVTQSPTDVPDDVLAQSRLARAAPGSARTRPTTPRRSRRPSTPTPTAPTTTSAR
ncbi:helicase HerA-like domain-containing protein [Nocardioides convexus]|uniref:helicase HerA-like domain-containing protein n=1 Tax=Nocardioides convexus TaxID=2712224 RepID=UPI00241899D3|nr:helicase HerA-like domain-containing protein [Nocardioides convexus]